MKRLISGVAVALLVAGLGACSSGSGGKRAACPAKVDTRAATAGAVTVCASDIKFDVKTITAPAGALKITLQNDGAIDHTFKIQKTSLELKTGAGKVATGTVTLTKGTYSFECTVAGHAAAGMKGTLVVG